MALALGLRYGLARPLFFSGALDALSVSPVAAYSLRRVRAAYAGPLIRARRSSDNTEADIGFSADGWLDQSALLAFVGAGSGFITTWYDQSGNARHATQTTAGDQPRIVNSGVVDTDGGRPTVVFDGVNDSLVGVSNIGLSGNPLFSLSSVNTATLPSAQVFTSFGSTASGAGFHYMGASSGANVWFGYASSTQLGTATLTTPSSPFVMSMVRSGTTGADWSVRQNGGALAVTAGNNNAVSLVDGPINIGRWVGASNFAAMRCPELIVHLSALSTSDRQTLERSQGAAFGITVA